MNTVMIIPTGLGCEIGGDAGDATPAARLLGQVSNKLILHPNVVNASDINEMPANALYVEGSMLDAFLYGSLNLHEVKSNKILVAVNAPAKPETINAINAARVTLGIDVFYIELGVPLTMTGIINDDGTAGGTYTGVAELLDQIKNISFDALAIATPIDVPRDVAKEYFKHRGVNPWGGIEAIVSRLITSQLNKPCAHAPIQPDSVLQEVMDKEWDYVCDPRMAPEIVSNCFLHCVLKGLHKAPRPCHPNAGFSHDIVDVLVSPMGCWGSPHESCDHFGIPIIVVAENTCILECNYHTSTLIVKNYLEAAGVIAAMDAGISLASLRRPIESVRKL